MNVCKRDRIALKKCSSANQFIIIFIIIIEILGKQ